MLQAEIMSCRFDPTGQNIAACSADRSVCSYIPYSYSTSQFYEFLQPSGGRTPQPPTMATSLPCTKPPSSTYNGPFSLRSSTPSPPTIRSSTPTLPQASARANYVPTAESSMRSTEPLPEARELSWSRPLQTTGACMCGREATKGGRSP